MGVGVYIDPPSRGGMQDRFLKPTTGRYHASLTRCLEFVKDTFEAQGVAVHTADLLPEPREGERYLYVSIGNHRNHARLARRPDVTLSAFMVTEAPVVEPRIYRGLAKARNRFKRIYSCIDQQAITEFVGTEVDCIPLRWPMDFRGVDEVLWGRRDRDLLVMINMNKLPRLRRYELFTERMRAVQHLSDTDAIDLYGIGWNEASMQMGRTLLPGVLQQALIRYRNWLDRRNPDPMLVAARKVYKGELDTKWETLASYDFVLCFENTELPGWLTEKLFEALYVGTIPIYRGATDIEELVDPDCFVDMRDFSDYDEMLGFIKSLDASSIQRYRDAGRAFLESKDYEPFSRESFAEIFQEILEEDAGVVTEVR